MRNSCICAIVLVCLVGMAGCGSSGPQWQLGDVEGHLPDLEFKLTSDAGNTVTEKDFRGKVVLLYFGYTHCPDVCPLTLARIHSALQQLAAADDARVLFVSVDPTRDKPNALRAYVSAFDPRITGLTGSSASIEALAKRYRAAFNREPAKSDGNYDVSHSSGIYVFDKHGRARLLATPSSSVPAIVHDVDILISSRS